jgi:hypothetical protein
LEQDASAATDGQLKKRARKKAKAAAPAPDANTPCEIPVELLKKLANAVATAPADLLASMDEYLGVRRACFQWFLKDQAKGIDNLTAQNNERQVSFSDKLEHVLTILKAKPAAATTAEVSGLCFRG